MQLVSREVLFDVMANRRAITLSQSIDEAETKAYQTFCRKATTEYSKSKDMDVFSEVMLKYLKSNKRDIRFVGQGSSRLVFALADGTALKLAKTDAGIAQNRHEAELCMDPKMKYEIFPDFYGADKKNWLSLNCELCAKAEKHDFKEILMAQPNIVAYAVEFAVRMTKGAKLSLQSCKKFFDQQNDVVKSNLFQQLIDNKTQAAKALNSLIDFYMTHELDELLLSDLESVENWGITVRDNQKTLVVIDAGFDDTVYQKFYKGKRQ